MRSLLVVIGQPVVRDRLDISERVKQARVEHFRPEAAVEPLDEGALVRLAGFDLDDPEQPVSSFRKLIVVAFLS
jgi:hypothetical protein